MKVCNKCMELSYFTSNIVAQDEVSKLGLIDKAWYASGTCSGEHRDDAKWQLFAVWFLQYACLICLNWCVDAVADFYVFANKPYCH